MVELEYKAPVVNDVELLKRHLKEMDDPANARASAIMRDPATDVSVPLEWMPSELEEFCREWDDVRGVLLHGNC